MRRNSIAVTVLLLAICMSGVAGCGRQLMPTPNIYVDAPVDPFGEVPPSLQTSDIDILYITDRKPEPTKDGRMSYGSERSRSLAFGSYIVHVGRDLSWETLVENSRLRKRTTSLPLRLGPITEQARFLDTPLPLAVVDGRLDTDPEQLALQLEIAGEFEKEVERRLAMTPRKDAFVFVHGFNNTFRDAAFRMAELWHFLGREGVPILYSWPAGHKGGLISSYTRDSESGQFTVYHLKTFIRFLASNTSVEQIHIVAHSRGTDVIAAALRELLIEATAAGVDPHATYRIGSFVFAAPDLDLEVVTQRLAAERFFRLVKDSTIYTNQHDKALGAASNLFDSTSRVGNLDPEDLDDHVRNLMKASGRVNVVDANVDTGFLGHGYFLGSPAVSSDLILILREERRPGVEGGRPLMERSPGFWSIESEKYPGNVKFGGSKTHAEP